MVVLTRLRWIFILTLLMYSMNIPLGFAWQCQPSTVEQNYKKADVVFHGQVLAVSKPKKLFNKVSDGTLSPTEDKFVEVSFKIIKGWKCPIGDEIKVKAIHTSLFGGVGYGDSFEKVTDWLIFAKKNMDGEYWIDQCDGTDWMSNPDSMYNLSDVIKKLDSEKF